VVSAVTASYLNVFVAIDHAFLKIQRQQELVPAQSEQPFALARLIGLISNWRTRAIQPDQTCALNREESLVSDDP
jgi:hypothetical protein